MDETRAVEVLRHALEEIRDHGKVEKYPCHALADADCIDLMRERARAALAYAASSPAGEGDAPAREEWHEHLRIVGRGHGFDERVATAGHVDQARAMVAGFERSSSPKKPFIVQRRWVTEWVDVPASEGGDGDGDR